MKKLYFVFLALLLGLALTDLPSVYAQDEFMLEEITVTAEKRLLDIQDIAMSVTAVTGVTIREKAQATLEDVLGDIASVSIAYANRGGQINIRGVGSYVDTTMADPAVAVIQDNIYNGNSLATWGNMYDLERIEVLRGPQGTLYGRNATGGTINIISQNPTHEFEVIGNLQVGDYNLMHFDGAVNFPLSDKLFGRVAVLRETRDGYIDSGDMDANAFGARAKLLYEPNDRFSVLVTFDYFKEDDSGGNSVPVPGSAGNLPCLGPPFNCGYYVPDRNGDHMPDDFLDANLAETADLDGDGWPDGDGVPDLVQTGWLVADPGNPWSNDPWHPKGSQHEVRKAWGLEVNYDFGWGVLTALPSLAEHKAHNIDSHLAGISRSSDGTLGDGQRQQRKQTSGEIRLTSPAESDWFWIAGYYYMKSDNAVPGFLDRDPTTYNDGDYHTASTSNPITSTALYAQTTYPVTDRFRVTGGIRQANDKEDRTFRIGLSDNAGLVLYDSGWVNYSSDVDSRTYKAGIEYDLTEDSMVYAQVATGFKQGGMNRTAPPIPFNPEDLVAYEAGIKNRFLEHRMQLNLEVYSYKYDQMQAQMPSTAPIVHPVTGAILGTQSPQMILNADEATLSGFDLEMDYLFTKADLFKVSFAYVKSELGHFVLPPNPFTTPSVPYDMTGKPVANSPEWSVKLSYQHTWELDTGATVTSSIDSTISDGYYKHLEYWQPYIWNDGFHRSNAGVTYKNADGNWSVGAWIKNIENGAQYTWSVPFWRQMIKPPRTFGINASFRY